MGWSIDIKDARGRGMLDAVEEEEPMRRLSLEFSSLK